MAVFQLSRLTWIPTERDDEYGEWLYWLSVMGTPSADEPWGWQLDGHHLIINCFILKDQMVLTPIPFAPG